MNKPTALQNGAHYTLTAAGDKNGTERRIMHTGRQK